jgi:transposase
VRTYSNTEEFKLGAVAQVTDKGHSVTSVAGPLCVSTKSLYDWVKRYGNTPDMTGHSAAQSEIKRLKAELRCVTVERDILKKAMVYVIGISHRRL